MSESAAFSPDELREPEWHKLYDIARFACEATMLVDPEVYLGRFDEFLGYHLYPQSRVGVTDNFNQEYHHPRVAVLRQAGEFVAWGAADHNVSQGNPDGPQDDSLPTHIVRTGKRLSVLSPVARLNYNYFHLREVYTSHQGEGEGTAVVRKLGKSAFPGQPWAVYVYRGIYKPEIPSLEANLLERGFHQTSPAKPKRKFGRDAEIIRLQRDHTGRGTKVF